VKPVDAATWKLEVGGLVKDKRPWTLDRINALPKVSQITRHVCVEGWDYIGKWSGVGLSRFLQTIEADLTAKYVAFECADDYSGSIDMASALHPQTQLTTHYADEPIGDPYGFPLRLRVATKLGFKMPKWITSIEVTNEYPGGYWEDRDYNWFSGL
jgi:DMSO/TMAO reductase YedYZ molybdopterin-dependent catalytic subunit